MENNLELFAIKNQNPKDNTKPTTTVEFKPVESIEIQHSRNGRKAKGIQISNSLEKFPGAKRNCKSNLIISREHQRPKHSDSPIKGLD